jgi:hypothetical protein
LAIFAASIAKLQNSQKASRRPQMANQSDKNSPGNRFLPRLDGGGSRLLAPR